MNYNFFAKMIMGIFVLVYPAMSLAGGALAIDQKKGDQWGWAIDYPQQSEANERALKECGEGCYIALEFSNGCAAYAADQTEGSTVWGWGRAASEGEAKSIASQSCSSRGGTSCLIRSWGCHSAENEVAQEPFIAFVMVDLKMAAENSKTRFCGYTSVSPAEEYFYSNFVYTIFFWDEHFGTEMKASFLRTSETGGLSVASNPVMQRFLPHIEGNPAYGNRDTRAEYYRGIEARYSTDALGRYWNFAGDILKVGDGLTVENLTEFYCRFMVEKNRGYGFNMNVVNVGKF